MPKFLNTKGLINWIPKIINETERALVIITPFMQLSDNIYNCLFNANKRGVETIIIYRENKLSDKDKTKLLALDNLNLMHHPNVHSKCYYNENYLLIASMNLYEYSEKNNREMGVLLHKIDIDEDNETETWRKRNDDEQIFQEALEEILEIKNGAELERMSRETIEEGFEMEILKTKKEKAEDRLKQFNKVFIHKKFVFDTNCKLGDENSFICKSYIDKVDIKVTNRFEFCFNIDENKLNPSFQYYKNQKKELEFKFEGFKFYWNMPNVIYLYVDGKHHIWENTLDNMDLEIKKRGINDVIEFIKPWWKQIQL
ncbi:MULTISPECIES: phospholipase D-like domain-containing protein [unclassified Flavobacterium]|uniref:phospholipase D-like domain-containing protein n=1 Tax=unclassified Flavobacterium TaxID=196869 RepID=UPI0025B93B47|nr:MULTISPECIES: phospholipase D-like domain-containing protein [unclassified Flavobacterium]